MSVYSILHCDIKYCMLHDLKNAVDLYSVYTETLVIYSKLPLVNTISY